MPVYKKTIAALLAAAALAVPAAAKDGRASERPERSVLTTETALELACANNPSLAAAEARIEQARQQIAQARADKLPKLYAALVGAWQGEEGAIPAYQGEPGHSIPIGYALNSFEEAYQAALGVQWLIFSSGAAENTIAARKMAFRGIQTREVRTGQAVENAVLVSYYNLQRARAKLGVAEEVLALSKEHLSQVRNFFKYGVVAQDEVLRVEVDVSNGELNVISAKNAVDVRWRALERAVGTELRSKFDLPEPNRNAAPKDAPQWDEASLYALRPELKALDFSRRAALAVAAAAQGSSGPKIVAGGEAFAQGRDFWPDELDTWKLSLSLRWDLRRRQGPRPGQRVQSPGAGAACPDRRRETASRAGSLVGAAELRIGAPAHRRGFAPGRQRERRLSHGPAALQVQRRHQPRRARRPHRPDQRPHPACRRRLRHEQQPRRSRLCARPLGTVQAARRRFVRGGRTAQREKMKSAPAERPPF